MKKLFAAFLLAGAVTLAGCKSKIYTSSDTKESLTKGGYTVQVYAETEAKNRITNLNYEGVSFKDALFAEKGADENKDLLIAFYFPSVKAAEDFLGKNDNENLGLLHDYGAKELGANLSVKVGTHNNVAFVGYTVSADAAGFKI